MGFYKTIQPDEQQKAKIDLILNKFAKINSELQNNFRKELDAQYEGIQERIGSEPLKEQQSRLKDMDDRRQEMIRQKQKEPSKRFPEFQR